MKHGYRMILTQKLFMRHIIASVINRFGDSVDAIAYAWLMYAITNSPTWSVVVVGINILPNVIIQPFAGVIVERLNKKRVMIFGDLARGFLTLLIFFFYINDVLSPWLLLLVTFLNNTFEAFRSPASTAFVPMILEETHYEFGLSLYQSSSRIIELVGCGMAGIIIASLGIQGAFIVDFLTFLMSAILIYTIPVNETLHKQSMLVSQYLKHCLQDMKEGLQFLSQKKVLWFIAMIACLLNMVLVPLNSLEVPYISGILKAPVYVLSLGSMAISIGISVGAILYPYMHKYISNRIFLLGGGITIGVYYLCLPLIAYVSSMYLIALCIFLANLLLGCCLGGIFSMSSILFMQNIESAYIARASAIQGSIATLGMPIITVLLSFVTKSVTILNIYIFCGVFTILIFVGMISLRIIKEI